ncbi:MAG: O-antigen ligase family protein [Sulfuritalea sp.]|nr:O-antigen ligase family protein [Sulfuritalea sp.]
MTALFYGLLGLLVWVPIPFGSNRPWPSAVMVILACGMMALWLVGYATGRFQLSDAFRSARWTILLGILGWMFVGLQWLPLPVEWVAALSPKAHAVHMSAAQATSSTGLTHMTLSVDPHATRDYWLRLLAYGCIFSLTLLLVDTREKLELLLKTLVFSGTLQAIYGSVMVLSGLEYGFFIKKFVNQGVATGTFINRNHLAGYLNLCLAAGIGLMIAKLGGEAVHTWRQWIRSIARLLLGEKTRLRIYLIIMVIALVLTRSRMGNTAFFASTLIVGVLGLLLMRNAPRSTMVFLASVIALDVLIVGTWFGIDQVAQRIQQTEVTSNASNVLPTEDRDEVASLALKMAADYLPTGAGAGSFYIAFPEYATSSIIGLVEYAHNDYLQTLAETGLIGSLTGGLVILLSTVQAISAMRRRNDPVMRGTAFGVTLAICWLLIHSTVDFNMQIPANALTMSVMLALGWVSATLKPGRRPSLNQFGEQPLGPGSRRQRSSPRR